MANYDSNDSDDLEALFDSIVTANSEESQGADEPAAAVVGGTMINQIGHMTRNLHNTLRELGLNKQVEKAAASIPDARDRLAYVASMTEKAAERVLTATEVAQPIMDKVGSESAKLAGQWQLLFDKKLDVEQFKNLVMQTQAFLNEVPIQTKATSTQLTEIMMAQDFQDLTGQVIKKITEVTKTMEEQLVSLLLETAPAEVKAEYGSGLLNGPVINAAGRTDVVTSQDQVDDLLESLGF